MTAEDVVAQTARRDAAALTTLDEYLEDQGLREALQAVAIAEVMAFQRERATETEG